MKWLALGVLVAIVWCLCRGPKTAAATRPRKTAADRRAIRNHAQLLPAQIGAAPAAQDIGNGPGAFPDCKGSSICGACK